MRALPKGSLFQAPELMPEGWHVAECWVGRRKGDLPEFRSFLFFVTARMTMELPIRSTTMVITIAQNIKMIRAGG